MPPCGYTTERLSPVDTQFGKALEQQGIKHEVAQRCISKNGKMVVKTYRYFNPVKHASICISGDISSVPTLPLNLFA